MRNAFRVSGLYAIVASAWILLSDRVIELFSDSASQLGLYSTVKGIAFVLSTSLMLFYLVRRELAAKNQIIRQLEKEAVLREELVHELHHRIKNNLQIVIGLVNLESRESASVDELNERIVRKLMSLSSVFNIVYNMRDMKSISLSAVLREYEQLLGGHSFSLSSVDDSLSYSVETITSLVLLVDAIHELSADAGLGLSLASIEEGRLDIVADAGFPEGLTRRIEGDDFIATMLGSAHGAMELSGDTLTVRFNPRKVEPKP